jgi:two-component system chemotaxis response regulator CheY
MLETLTDILSAAGYAVTSVSDGDRAVQEIAEGSYDVVVMDVRMPGRDGVSVMVDSGAPPPPVILMTAYAVEERLRDARAAKVHAVVQKPFAPPYLLDLLASAVAA